MYTIIIHTMSGVALCALLITVLRKIRRQNEISSVLDNFTELLLLDKNSVGFSKIPFPSSCANKVLSPKNEPDILTKGLRYVGDRTSFVSSIDNPSVVASFTLLSEGNSFLITQREGKLFFKDSSGEEESLFVSTAGKAVNLLKESRKIAERFTHGSIKTEECLCA